MKTRSVISALVCLSLILLATALTEADVTQAALPPAAVPQSLPVFSQITAGEYHTCALTAAGRVKCWGDNQYGQLGDGTTTNRSTPVDVSELGSGVMALAAGGYHTCALMDAVHGGGVKCWGNNGGGQLGDGTTTDRSTPVDVSGLGSQVLSLVLGSGHTCALTTTGGVKCWGANWYGQLGDGTNTDRSTPVNVNGLGSGIAMLAAGKYHTCALFTDGGVKCWGYNVHGQLGDGTTDVRYGPVAVIGLGSGVAMLMAGWERTCVLMDAAHGGGAKCWGWNFWGQLGDGTTTDSNTPVDAIWLGSGVTTVGQSHTCALMSASYGGMLKCWGWNGSGQLGDG
ncbi:MAG: hypothetical protein HY870_08065, partial [Chloroflexi bacterium]|nr:hypothetical protein [Chloroflexota bacterium]